MFFGCASAGKSGYCSNLFRSIEGIGIKLVHASTGGLEVRTGRRIDSKMLPTPLLPVKFLALKQIFFVKNLYTLYGSDGFMQLPECPQLREIIMADYTEVGPYFANLQSGGVESLVFHNGNKWYSQDRFIITRFTSLRSLVLGTGLDKPCRH